MASQVFYRKWRPQTLAEVVGQEPVTQTLLNALRAGRISHAYLFCGPRGTGKTSTARILAKAANCLKDGHGEPCNQCEMCQAITEGRSLDVIEVDAASNTGVDDIRSLREKVGYAPSQARYKVYIIDEVHMLSGAASNALLKTLEEPPPFAIFIPATTETHKILPTIMSRCQRFDFRRLSQADIAAKLSGICQAEGISAEPEAIRLIARSATGSLRDAENLLQQLTTYYGTDISLVQVREMLGISGDARTRELAGHIARRNITAGIATIHSANNDGLNLKQFNRELVEYLRNLMIVKAGAADTLDLTPEDLAELKALADEASLPHILKAIRLFGALDFGGDASSTLPLELALVDAATPEATPAAAPEATPPPAPAPAAAATPPSPGPVKKKAASPPPAASPAASKEAIPPTGPAPGTTDEVQRLRQEWRRVIQEAPAELRRTPALAMLRSAGVEPVAIEDNTVVLSSRFSWFKEKLEDPENLRTVERIIGAYLGRACRVRCISQDNHLIREALRLGARPVDTEE